MERGYWVIRTYKAGRVGEKIKYYVPGERPTRSKRRMKTEIRKQAWNEGDRERRLARTLRANYTSRDVLQTMTYSGQGLERLGGGGPDELYRAAHHQLHLWIERTRRACGRAGVPFRYVAVTSDVDVKTGELVRVHHHVVINREAAELARSKWGLGVVHQESLQPEEEDVTRLYLAEYLLKQARRLPDKKKYIPSRNLIIPQPKDRVAVSGAELAVPRGGALIYRGPSVPGQPQYLSYILPEFLDPTQGRGGG